MPCGKLWIWIRARSLSQATRLSRNSILCRDWNQHSSTCLFRPCYAGSCGDLRLAVRAHRQTVPDHVVGTQHPTAQRQPRLLLPGARHGGADSTSATVSKRMDATAITGLARLQAIDTTESNREVDDPFPSGCGSSSSSTSQRGGNSLAELSTSTKRLPIPWLSHWHMPRLGSTRKQSGLPARHRASAGLTNIHGFVDLLQPEDGRDRKNS